MIIRLLEVEVLAPGGIALTKSATWLLPMRRRSEEWASHDFFAWLNR